VREAREAEIRTQRPPRRKRAQRRCEPNYMLNFVQNYEPVLNFGLIGNSGTQGFTAENAAER
jgi:hypothetical protein